jgi:hypothetical protein
MRREDWPERLVAVLDRTGGEAFAWGVSDCFTLAMDVVEALTGADPWASERGTYQSGAGAVRRLAANGFADLPAFLGLLGAEIAPAFGRRGDLGLTADAVGGLSIVVCDGAAWVGRAEHTGLLRIPIARVCRAWRID